MNHDKELREEMARLDVEGLIAKDKLEAVARERIEDTRSSVNVKPTATPWHVVTLKTKYPDLDEYSIMGVNDEPSPVYSGKFFTVATGMDSLADAQLIVKAVNSHDALVRELRHLIDLIQPPGADGPIVEIPGLATLNGARAAIALAEKGE
jgi:hypothetical protein